MSAYIIVALFLIGLALLDVEYPRSRPACAAASLMLVTAFAALRYQTGYDWLVYEDFFNSTVDLETALYRGIPPQDRPMEPLFYALNMLIKSIGGSLTLLFAIVAVFNCYIIHAVTGRISDGRSLMWALYFALVFPIAQLSIIRQSLAASFVLLALLMAARGAIVRAALFLVAGMGFHASVALYLPVLFLRRRRPTPWLVALGGILGVLLVLADVRLINPAIDFGALLLPDWLADKLQFYHQIEPAHISAGTAALMLWHLGVLGILFGYCSDEEARCPYITIGLWLTIWVLFAHIFMAGFPNLWNRVMCVSVPWQIAALWRLDRIRHLHATLKLGSVAALGLAGLAGLVYTLAKPESLPLVPYQSLVELWVYGYPGNGRLRSELWLEEYYATTSQKRWELSD